VAEYAGRSALKVEVWKSWDQAFLKRVSGKERFHSSLRQSPGLKGYTVWAEQPRTDSRIRTPALID
jgi:hypothetical protein